MTKWIYTKEEKWIKKWNSFVLSDERSSFLQSSYRVNTYRKYGMDWELLICIDEKENILLGSANVIVKLPFFKLYISSYGPTISSYKIVSKLEYDEFFYQFNIRAKELNAFVAQITVPIDLSVNYKLKSIDGKIFTNITNPQYKNIINLKANDKWLEKEDLIGTFLSKGRRDVRASYRKGLVSKYPTTEKELQEAYSCIEINAKNKGYNVRGWNEMKDLIKESVKDKTAFIVSAWYDNKIQGAILLEKSHNKLSYTMGGVYRHSPDLLTGYFLQVEAMLLAQKLNIGFYDISYGGPKEVQRFKKMFKPILNESYKTIHFKHSNIKYFIFNKFYNILKSKIPKIISIKNKMLK